MTEVKKAVIPAAGLGTRFLPATKAQPKEMLPLVDTPSIQFVVQEAIDSGIDDILIISGRGKRAIEDHFDKPFELESVLRSQGKEKELDDIHVIPDDVNIHYVRQKETLGLGDAIRCAEKHINNEPFAVLLGDDIVFSKTPCTKQLMDLYSKYRTSIIAVEEVSREMIPSYGIVDCARLEDSVYKVNDLVEKPPAEKAPSNLGIIGRYILTPETFDAIKQTNIGVKGEIQLTDALRILNKIQQTYAYKFKGIRYDLGNKYEYMKANLEYAFNRSDIGPKLKEHMRKLIEGEIVVNLEGVE